MATHSPLPAGTVSTKALLFLIGLIIVGVATTLICCHFLLKPDKKLAVVVEPTLLLLPTLNEEKVLCPCSL